MIHALLPSSVLAVEFVDNLECYTPHNRRSYIALLQHLRAQSAYPVGWIFLGDGWASLGVEYVGHQKVVQADLHHLKEKEVHQE